MGISLEYVRDSIVRIIKLADYEDLMGVIACYKANASTMSVNVTMSVLPLYEDNIFPDIYEDFDKSELITKANEIFKIERPNEKIFHKDHFKTKFDGSHGEHFELDINSGSIINYNKEKIKIGNDSFSPLNSYFNDLDNEIRKGSDINYDLINSFDQCYFSSGCSKLLIIPIPLLSTPVFLLVLDATNIDSDKKVKLIREVYNLSKITVRHFILTNLIDGLKNQLTNELNEIKNSYDLITRFKDELCKILLPIEWEIGRVLKKNDWPTGVVGITEGSIKCSGCINHCGKVIDVDVCKNVRYLYNENNDKQTVRICEIKDGKYVENWPDYWAKKSDELVDLYYFHFFVSLNSEEDKEDISKKYIICLAQTSFKFPNEQGVYEWIQELPDYDIAASQLGSMLSSIFNLIYNQWKEIQKVHTHATRAAISQVMARNMSHNIGSHVMNHLIDGKQIVDLDAQIKNQNSYQSCFDYSAIVNDNPLNSNNQLAYFNNYIKCRMDYLSEVTFGVPTMQTTRKIQADVFKDFDKVRLLLNNISGINKFIYQLCFKYNDKHCSVDDVAVSFPSDLLGVQAFYNILENIIRNTAKHDQNKGESTTFTIHIRDIDPKEVAEELKDEAALYYKVEITDGIRKIGTTKIISEKLTEEGEREYRKYKEIENDNEWITFKNNDINKIDWLVDSQNMKINQSVLDKSNNQLRTNSLGLLEMEASAAFLRKIDMPDIESDDYQVLSNNEIYNRQTKKFNILKAIKIDGALGYRIFLSKPQEFLFVGNWTEIKTEKKAELLKYGIWFRSTDDFKTALENKIIFHHQFVLYDQESKSDKLLSKVFSDKRDDLNIITLKNALPIRLLEINNKTEIIECLFNATGFDFNNLENIIWQLWVDKINPDNKGISIHSSCPKVNDDFNIVLFNHLYDDHGNTCRKQWDDAVELFKGKITLYMEALSTNAQSKLPNFLKLTTNNNFSAYFEPIGVEINKNNKYKIFESYLNKILVIDERIQKFSTQDYLSGLKEFSVFELSNIIVPKYEDIKLDELDFTNEIIQKIEMEFIEKHICRSQFMLIHYGILERMFTKEIIYFKLVQWSKQTRVIITSGRGKQSLNLPPQVCYVNLSPISNVFIENRNKYSINYLLNQTRK